MSTRRLPYLEQHVDGLGVVMTRGNHNGFPVLTWGWADRRVLATVRQLRSRGLRPGGQDPVALLVFGHRKQARATDFARLYLIERALPKRTATPAQRVAIDAALRARRTCSGPCGEVQDYFVSTISRMCGACETATDFWARYAAEHGYSWEAA